MMNPLEQAKQIIKEVPNSRVRDVIFRRFGLKNGRRETLESIGKNYGITRERVRQIEENGYRIIKESQSYALLKPVFNFLQNHIESHGYLRRESQLLRELASNFITQNKSQDEIKKQEGAIALFLTSGQPFNRHSQNEKFYPVWSTHKKFFKKAEKIIGSLIDYLNTQKTVMLASEISDFIYKKNQDIKEKHLFSYIDAAKAIEQNHLGQFGLYHWPEIRPRGVRDKSYIILKKEKQPLHFKQITHLINQENFDQRQAYIQTVHNELIKDPRFILVGRGTYALDEWGYQVGTVTEVIKQTLKENGPLTRDDIIKKVLNKRLVKENTVLINLRNRKFFQRGKSGKYTLV